MITFSAGNPFLFADHYSIGQRLDRDELAAALKENSSRLLVAHPQEAAIGLPDTMPRNDAAVDGDRFFNRHRGAGAEATELIIGELGVSILSDDRWTTIEWDHITLVLEHNDGRWTVFGKTGVELGVDFTDWFHIAEVRRLFEDRVPAAVRLKEARGNDVGPDGVIIRQPPASSRSRKRSAIFPRRRRKPRRIEETATTNSSASEDHEPPD